MTYTASESYGEQPWRKFRERDIFNPFNRDANNPECMESISRTRTRAKAFFLVSSRPPFIPFSTPGELTFASNRSLSIGPAGPSPVIRPSQKYGVAKIAYCTGNLHQFLCINLRTVKRKEKRKREREAVGKSVL